MAHPYVAYESEWLWEVLKKAIDDLIENGDLVEQTAREYVTGYICKQILDKQNQCHSS